MANDSLSPANSNLPEKMPKRVQVQGTLTFSATWITADERIKIVEWLDGLTNSLPTNVTLGTKSFKEI